MRRRKLLATFILLLMLLSLAFALVGFRSAQAWWRKGHRITTTHAIQLLPAEWRAFYERYEWYLNLTCTYPDDAWPEVDPKESPRHWYHVEYVGNHLLNPDEGVLPWAVENMTKLLVTSLKAGDWNEVLIASGALSHYISDATQPHHATQIYDPYGKHSIMDGTLEKHLQELRLVSPVDLVLIPNSTAYAIRVLEQSFNFLEQVNATLIGDPNDPGDDRDWSPSLREVVENRTNTAIVATALLWHTAIVEAGVSPPRLPSEEGILLNVIKEIPDQVDPSQFQYLMVSTSDTLGVSLDATVEASLEGTELLVREAIVWDPVGKHRIELSPGDLESFAGSSATLRITAEKAGFQAASLEVILRVLATETTTKAEEKLPTYTAAILIIVVVVVVGSVFILRRRKRQQQSTDR